MRAPIQYRRRPVLLPPSTLSEANIQQSGEGFHNKQLRLLRKAVTQSVRFSTAVKMENLIALVCWRRGILTIFLRHWSLDLRRQ